MFFVEGEAALPRRFEVIVKALCALLELCRIEGRPIIFHLSGT